MTSTRTSSCLTRRCRCSVARSRRGRAATGSWCAKRCMTLAKTYGIDPDAPFAKLPKKHRDLVLYGPASAAKAAKAAPKDGKPAVEDDDEDAGEQEFELPKRRASNGRDGGGVAGSIRPRIRRNHSQPPTTVRRGIVDGPGGPRAVSHAARMSGMPRTATQVAEPGGEGQGPRHRGLREPADQRGARGLRGVRADRARDDDCQPRPARDSRASPLSP